MTFKFWPHCEEKATPRSSCSLIACYHRSVLPTMATERLIASPYCRIAPDATTEVSVFSVYFVWAYLRPKQNLRARVFNHAPVLNHMTALLEPVYPYAESRQVVFVCYRLHPSLLLAEAAVSPKHLEKPAVSENPSELSRIL